MTTPAPTLSPHWRAEFLVIFLLVIFPLWKEEDWGSRLEGHKKVGISPDCS